MSAYEPRALNPGREKVQTIFHHAFRYNSQLIFHHAFRYNSQLIWNNYQNMLRVWSFLSCDPKNTVEARDWQTVFDAGDEIIGLATFLA
jgi:hypothetical protein